MPSNITSSASIPKYPNVNVWAGPGEDYATVALAVSGEAKDNTGLGPFVIGVRKAFRDTDFFNPADWDGWITTDFDYIHLWVHPDVRHNGYWDVTKARFETQDNQYNQFIRVDNVDIAIQGFQISTARSGSTGGNSGISNTGSGSLYVSDCIIKRISAPNLEEDFYYNQAGIVVSDRTGELKYTIIENNIIYNYYNGIRISGTPATQTEKIIIQNNTIIDCVGSGSGASATPAGINLQTFQSGSQGSLTDLTTCARNNLVYNSPYHMAKSPYNSVTSNTAYTTGSGDPLPDDSYDTHNVGWDSSAPFGAHTSRELITNGGFDADTDWTKLTGWTISGGVAVCDGTNSADLRQFPTLTPGNTYRLEFEITALVAGAVRPRIGGQNGTDRNSVGTYTENIVAGTTVNRIDLRSVNFSGSIDNVSIKEVRSYEHFSNLTPNFVDYAGEDFRLSANNEHLRVGLDLSNDDFAPLTTDITGKIRDTTKGAFFVGAHSPTGNGYRSEPINPATMVRKYRGRR